MRFNLPVALFYACFENPINDGGSWGGGYSCFCIPYTEHDCMQNHKHTPPSRDVASSGPAKNRRSPSRLRWGYEVSGPGYGMQHLECTPTPSKLLDGKPTIRVRGKVATSCRG